MCALIVHVTIWLQVYMIKSFVVLAEVNSQVDEVMGC